MEFAEILNLILSILTLGAIIFAIYKYFREPDVKADKELALIRQEFIEHKKINAEEQKRIYSLIQNLKDNHIHTIDEQVKNNRDMISGLKVEITKLATVIEERIPKR